MLQGFNSNVVLPRDTVEEIMKLVVFFLCSVDLSAQLIADLAVATFSVSAIRSSEAAYKIIQSHPREHDLQFQRTMQLACHVPCLRTAGVRPGFMLCRPNDVWAVVLEFYLPSHVKTKMFGCISDAGAVVHILLLANDGDELVEIHISDHSWQCVGLTLVSCNTFYI